MMKIKIYILQTDTVHIADIKRNLWGGTWKKHSVKMIVTLKVKHNLKTSLT